MNCFREAYADVRISSNFTYAVNEKFFLHVFVMFRCRLYCVPMANVCVCPDVQKFVELERLKKNRGTIEKGRRAHVLHNRWSSTIAAAAACWKQIEVCDIRAGRPLPVVTEVRN